MVAKAIFLPENKLGQQLKRVKIASDKTMGEIVLPEAAPLIYPAIDKAATQVAERGDAKNNEKKSDKLMSSRAFIAECLDRRAQVEYIGKNSGSKLAVPANLNKTFASIFANPHYHVNSASIISLLTGGTFDLKARRRRSRDERIARLRGQDPSTEEMRMGGSMNLQEDENLKRVGKRGVGETGHRTEYTLIDGLELAE